MSDTYSVGLITVSFTAADDSWSEQSGSEVNVLGFPGGNSVAISIAGQRETTRTFKALLANTTDFRTLRSLRGQAGSLQIALWDSVPTNAILKRIAPDPIFIDGEVYAQLQFVLY